MWEKIKANYAFIYVGIILVGYFGYVIHLYGFEAFMMEGLRSKKTLPTGTVKPYTPFESLMGAPLIFVGYLIMHFYWSNENFAKAAFQIFILIFIALLIYMSKNM